MDKPEVGFPLPAGSAAKRARPRLMPELRSMARSKTVSALNVLYRIMMSDKSSPRVRMAAANAILDRGWGRPVQAIEGGDNPFQIISRIERHIVDPSRPDCVGLIALSNQINQITDSELPHDDDKSNGCPCRTALNCNPAKHE